MATAGFVFVSVLSVISITNLVFSTEAASLQMGFYQRACPSAETLVRKIAQKHVAISPAIAARLLRMHFHDCFVRGCDGSILLNSTKNKKAEKDAAPNLTVRGFHVIDEAKREVEKHCPGVVSCADILALVTRDAVSIAFGGPHWRVPTGRRDGLISAQAEPLSNLPFPSFNFSQLVTSFARKGLNVKDLVVLSGGHTVGISHCSSFSNRLYNFSGKGDTDPSLDKSYAAELKERKCKSPTDNTTVVKMDPGSVLNFDTHYYYNLVRSRGLFQSDAALLTNSISKAYVYEELQGSPAQSNNRFFDDFARSMEKMGKIDVLTGSAGEIRQHCAFVNR